MSDLTYEIPPSGFALGSRGHGQDLDRTYGLALCPGESVIPQSQIA